MTILFPKMEEIHLFTDIDLIQKFVSTVIRARTIGAYLDFSIVASSSVSMVRTYIRILIVIGIYHERYETKSCYA